MAKVPVTFEGSKTIYETGIRPFNLLKRASTSQFEAQPINIPATHQEFLAYQEFMSSPFQLENFKYEFLLIGDYLQDEDFDSLLDFYHEQLLLGSIPFPRVIAPEYLEIIFRGSTREYTPGQIGFLLEQDNVRLNWNRDPFPLYPYFPIRLTSGFEWKIPLLAVSYQIENFNLPNPDQDYSWSDLTTFKVEYLDWAVSYGLVQVVQYLAKAAHLTREDIRSDYNRILRLAAKSGYLAMVKYLVKEFKLTKNDILGWLKSPLSLVAENGHLEIIKYFVRHFNLSKADIRSWFNPPLSLAAKNGHLEVVKYLVNHFHLTVTDIRSQSNYALRRAAAQGHLKMVQYLVEEFDLTIEDLQTFRDEPLREAASHGHLEVVKYLVDHFHLTVTDIRSLDMVVLIEAARHGQLEVVKYLVGHFHLTAVDIRSQENKVLIEAASHGTSS